MIQIPVHSFSEKKNSLAKFGPQSETWIVSDLQSKWEIQGKLLEHCEVLDEDAVLRASEFWAKLLFRLHPDWTLISRELFDQWIWNFLKKNPLPWLKVDESASLIHQHLEFFAPILIESQSVNLLEEWFEKNPDSVIKWRHLFEICHLLWREMNQSKILSPSLTPALLLQKMKEEDQKSLLWERKIHLDLGLNPKPVERSLAEYLSLHHDLVWIENIQPSEALTLNGELKRLPTQLGEVKEVVSQVRGLLNQGVEPRDVLILAPDIEIFWPSLNYFFKVEGVPCNKPFVQRLVDDPSIQKWLSCLRVEMNQFSSHDLESYFFQKSDSLKMKFDEFRYFFEKMRKPEQAERWSLWKTPAKRHDETLSLVSFFEWAIGCWPRSFKAEPLDRVWKVLSKDFDPKVVLSLSDWIFYLESKLSKSEVVVEEAHLDGVQLLSLSSAEWSEANYAFFIGINESDLAPKSFIAVSKFECEKLNQDLGFDLHIQDESIEELYLKWISNKEINKQYFYTSGVTLSGEEVSPSKYWLKSAYEKDIENVKKVFSPNRTRFDEILLSTTASVSEEETVRFDSLALSATSIKSYKECPFIFFAQKGLKLVDQPVLDFDLDPLNKGRLLHAVFEELILDLKRYSQSTEDVLKVIEGRKSLLKIEVGESRIWPAMRTEALKLSLNFIRMELELREEKENLKTLASEVGFEFFFDPKTDSLSKEATGAESVKVTGRIDRIDGLKNDSGDVALVDYKLSSSRLKGWGSWLEDGDLQMSLYSLAVENKFLTGEALDHVEKPESVAAYYMVPRDKERTKGYFLKEKGSELFIEPSKRSRSWLSQEKKSELYKGAVGVMKEVVQDIRDSKLSPSPRNFDLCETCRWRNLCRAEHLI